MISLRKVYFFIIEMYIATMAFELPIRYTLSIMKIEPLIYLRDLLLLFGIIVFLINETLIKEYLYWMIGILFFSVVGVYFTTNIIEVGMAIKIFLPLYYGVLISKYYILYIDQRRKSINLLFWGIVIGMILQYLFEDLPWFNMNNPEFLGKEGFTPNQMLIWVNDAEDPFTRMSGFCRLYNTTAMFMTYVVLWYMIYKPKINYLLIGGIVIFGTLAKANIGIYLLLVVAFLIKHNSYKMYILYLKLMIGVFVINMLVLPFLSLMIQSIISNLDTLTMIFLFGGFDDRLVYSWPITLANIFEYGSILLGRGIGGVGLSTTLFDVLLPVTPPIDNFAVLIYGTCGIFGVYLIIYCTYRFVKMNIVSNFEQFILLFWFVFCGNGIMADMTDTMSLFLLGISISFVRNRKSEKEKVNIISGKLL